VKEQQTPSFLQPFSGPFSFAQRLSAAVGIAHLFPVVTCPWLLAALATAWSPCQLWFRVEAQEGAGNFSNWCVNNRHGFEGISVSLVFQNLNQNPRTLLPKFYGLYCVQAGGKNIRIVVMNNLLPRSVKMHLKYDLKGSTYKRRASQKEREKVFPTYKDLDFMQDIPDGLFLDSDMYNALCKTLQRDCLVSGRVKGGVESSLLFSRASPTKRRWQLPPLQPLPVDLENLCF